MRLNQYIAHCGICSRRNADEIIKRGEVSINDQIVLTMGTIVDEKDIVKLNGKVIKPEKYVYILLNKPKDYITTTDDEKERKTVLDLIMPKLKLEKGMDKIRIYPVGRLDRNTTGLLLLTNDGELTQNLTHPKFEIEKIYIATLDKNIRIDDMQKIADGLTLEDGPIKVDEIAIPDPKAKNKVGIAIHSGKNRIVRRIFEHMGYEVKGLDRIVFAGLTKKDLPRSFWRHLDENEIGMLKNLTSKKKTFSYPVNKKTKPKSVKGNRNKLL